MNVQSPHKWWSTLKSAVFGSSSSLPPLVCPGGGLVCESVVKADLLSDHFDSKQSRESDDLPVAGRKWAQIYIYIYKHTLLNASAYFEVQHTARWHSPLRHRSDVPNPPTISRHRKRSKDIYSHQSPFLPVNPTLRNKCAPQPVLHTLPY